jgi:hypothetical protein
MGSQKVNIKCNHCGSKDADVDDSRAVPGVLASYVDSGVKDHLGSVDHHVEFLKAESISKSIRELGGHAPERPESATGRVNDFTHGKDHN